MKVLVAFEHSGAVREAFRMRGVEAWSCDLLPSDDGSEYHVKGDALGLIAQRSWDIIIMHPPCTALAVSGNRYYGEGKPKYQERLEAVRWTKELWELAVHSASIGVCMENPVGVLSTMAGLKPTQYIHPWQFGHPEQKKTGLWLHGLPPLRETENVYEHMMTLPLKERTRIHYASPGEDRWKVRSRTFEGIAEAMANQWGGQ